ncbi:MAG: hypothetical protein ACO33Y_09350 [Burkholderiaceae bacterium]
MTPIEPTSLPVTPKDADLLATEAIEDDGDFPDEETILRGLEAAIAARETETISLKIPKSVMISLAKVAEHHDMSLTGLIQFYIGQGLRQHLQDLEA